MTERYGVAIALIVLLVAAAGFAFWQMRRNATRHRRSRRIDVGTDDRS